MPLTAKACQAAKFESKPVKLSDGAGLYLLVLKSGKYWRLDFRLNGRRNTHAIGVYPTISLKEAREHREDARRLINAGKSPNRERERRLGAASGDADNGRFAVVAERWKLVKSDTWSDSRRATVQRQLDLHVLPKLGNRQVGEIEPRDVLELLRGIVDQGKVELAHKIKSLIGQILRFAVAESLIKFDPTRDLVGAIPKKGNHKHHAAIVDPAQFGALLHSINATDAGPVVKTALQLAPLVFVRPGELRHAEWAEMNLEDRKWVIPGSKTKTAEDLIVPLSQQALTLLELLHPLTGRGKYVFPSNRSPLSSMNQRPMSENTLSATLKRIGYSGDVMTVHGFRASARTMLDEQLEQPVHLIEHQLGHIVRDALGRAYNRTKHLRQRTAMMQDWSDFLTRLVDSNLKAANSVEVKCEEVS